MRKNIGSTDRVLRVVIGLALLSLVVVGPQTPWGFLGLIPLLTAFVSFCPAYRILGINSCARA